jgi:invasion protein IalB
MTSSSASYLSRSIGSFDFSLLLDGSPSLTTQANTVSEGRRGSGRNPARPACLQTALEMCMRRVAPTNLGRWLIGATILTVASTAAAQQPPPQRPATVQSVTQPAPQKPAAAAPSTQPQAATNETPQRTTATYDDWVMQCETQVGSPPQKICQMTQQTLVQGKNTPFSLVIIPHPVKGQPVKLVVEVPVNVSFASNARIRSDDADAGLAAPFARCLPAGCFAEFDLKDDMLKKYRATSSVGKLSFADAGGHEIDVPLSLKGFAQAYDALLRE